MLNWPCRTIRTAALRARAVGREGTRVAKASELRKDVINIRTGRRLGELVDVEIDESTGRITALVVPGPSRLWGLLGGEKDIVIPWQRIVRIGPDCILVDWEDGAGPGAAPGL